MAPLFIRKALPAALLSGCVLAAPAEAQESSGVLQRLQQVHTVSGLAPGAVARFRERTSGEGFYIRYGSGGRIGSLQVYEGSLTATSAELRDSILAKIVRARPRRIQTNVMEVGEWTSELGEQFATAQFRTIHKKRESDEYLFARASGGLGFVVRYTTVPGQGSRADAERFAAELLTLLR